MGEIGPAVSHRADIGVRHTQSDVAPALGTVFLPGVEWVGEEGLVCIESEARLVVNHSLSIEMVLDG